MNWQTDVSKINIGVDYLIQTTTDQYMAGTFARGGSFFGSAARTATKAVVFTSSDGSWTFDTKEVLRFVEIE